ncbi:hypothetical protein [Fibrobacter sp.]|uniref:hypothetical protein n=1 Tax=Fibrobacter sp. TaxID=35828 RepID=UPI0038670ECC
MIILAFLLSVAIVFLLHKYFVSKNANFTTRICITGANILLSLIFIGLLIGVGVVQDKSNTFIDEQISNLEIKVNKIYPGILNEQMSTVQVKDMLVKSLTRNDEGSVEAVAGNIAKTFAEDFTSTALKAIQSLERTDDKLSVKDALVSIKEYTIANTMPYLGYVKLILFVVYIICMLLSLGFTKMLNSSNPKGIVFGEEASKTKIGMKNID